MLITENTRETLLRLSQTLSFMASNVNQNRHITQVCEERGIKYLADPIIELVQRFELEQQAKTVAESHLEKAYDCMLSDTIGGRASSDPEVRTRQIERLKDCLSSMPDNQMYEAIMKEYTGNWPDEPCRPGIFEHPNSNAPNMPDFGLDLARAKQFLSEKNRQKYIAESMTDLFKYFSNEEQAILWTMHVYVLRDLARLTDNDILSVSKADSSILRFMAKLYNRRQIAIELKHLERK